MQTLHNTLLWRVLTTNSLLLQTYEEYVAAATACLLNSNVNMYNPNYQATSAIYNGGTYSNVGQYAAMSNYGNMMTAQSAPQPPVMSQPPQASNPAMMMASDTSSKVRPFFYS